MGEAGYSVQRDIESIWVPGWSAKRRLPKSAGRMGMRGTNSGGVLSPRGAEGGPLKSVPPGAQTEGWVKWGAESGGVLSIQGARGGPLKGVTPQERIEKDG